MHEESSEESTEESGSQREESSDDGGDEDDAPSPDSEGFDAEVLDSSPGLADEEDADLEGSVDNEENPSVDLAADDERVMAIERSAAPLSRFDPLSAYMREVQRHALLSPDEEHSLAVN